MTPTPAQLPRTTLSHGIANSPGTVHLNLSHSRTRCFNRSIPSSTHPTGVKKSISPCGQRWNPRLVRVHCSDRVHLGPETAQDAVTAGTILYLLLSYIGPLSDGPVISLSNAAPWITTFQASSTPDATKGHSNVARSLQDGLGQGGCLPFCRLGGPHIHKRAASACEGAKSMTGSGLEGADVTIIIFTSTQHFPAHLNRAQPTHTAYFVVPCVHASQAR